MPKVYDYLVIGAGSGGIASARRAALYGAKVAVVEMDRSGGTCLNRGCVPKKVMWNAATMAETIHEAKSYGFDVSLTSFSWETLCQKREEYIERLNRIYESNFEKDQIDFIKGFASFVDTKTVSVNGETYSTKHILITVGSKAWIPDIPGGREFGITSDGFFLLKHLPKKVALIGAGYIAIELAGVLHHLGSDVTLIIRHEEFLRTFDEVIKHTVMQEYEKQGIKIMKSSVVTQIRGQSDGKKVLNIKKTDGSEVVMDDVEQVIFAVGRDPNTDNLGLEKTTVKRDTHGFIVVDEFQNTDNPGVYALGDICGTAMLTPVAIKAGRLLSDRLFGGVADAKMDYTNIPSVVFSHPVCGSVGLTEEEAVKLHGKENIKTYQSKFINMYYAMMEVDKKQPSVYKLVTLLPNEKVLGVHLVGRASDEILQGFAVAVKMGATKKDLDATVAIHPVAAEELVTMR